MSGPISDNIYRASGVVSAAVSGIDWVTTPKTGDFTGEGGKGYFVDTSGGAVTATLPASPSAGDKMAVVDYTNTAATNNITIGRNSQPIYGATSNAIMSTNGTAVTFLYVDATEGWKAISTGDETTAVGPDYMLATGGTITENGNFKVHTFTADATFEVTDAGGASGSNSVGWVIVAGGGGSGGMAPSAGVGSGAGGAGGMLTNYPQPGTGGTSVTATTYPIVIGGGGAGAPASAASGTQGVDSTGLSLTVDGGGYGGYRSGVGGAGGSGGGAGGLNGGAGTAGAGNTPPRSSPGSPVQGHAGGATPSGHSGAGGGGAGAVGGDSTFPDNSPAVGGAGISSSIPGSATHYAGGGGGGGHGSPGAAGGAGGGGAGGAHPGNNTGTAGTDGLGGGGGGCTTEPGGGSAGSDGGNGVMIITYQFQ